MPIVNALRVGVALLLVAPHVTGQDYSDPKVVVRSYAGSGFYGFLDGKGTATMFNKPADVVAAPSGNLFVWDEENRCIRRIDPQVNVTTFVGGALNCYPPPGSGSNVCIAISDLQIDPKQNLLARSYDWGTGKKLLRIDQDSSAHLTNSWPNFTGDLCFEAAGTGYYTDSVGNRVYVIRTNGVVEILAGSGNMGSRDGTGIFSSFFGPGPIAVNSSGEIYLYDGGNRLIRKITPSGEVSTIAGKLGVYTPSDGYGTNASMLVYGMVFDTKDNLIMACGKSVRMMDPTGKVTTIAGSFTDAGFVDGGAADARFAFACSVCVVGNTIFVADRDNHVIRSIVAPSGPEPDTADLSIGLYPGITLASGSIGRRYSIQTSADAQSWLPTATITVDKLPFLWLDTNAVGQSNRFYRALLLP